MGGAIRCICEEASQGCAIRSSHIDVLDMAIGGVLFGVELEVIEEVLASVICCQLVVVGIDRVESQTKWIVADQ